MQKKNIAVEFEIDSLPELSIAPTYLSAILTNVLNNAIEANLGVMEKERYLNVKIFVTKIIYLLWLQIHIIISLFMVLAY